MCWTPIPLPWGSLQYLWSVLLCLFVTGLARLPLLRMCVLTISILLSKWKRNYSKSYSSSKKFTQPSFQECVKQRYLKGRITHLTVFLLWSTNRSQFKPFTASASLQQALAGSQKGTDINASLPSCFLARLPLTAYRWHHPWSHCSLASSQEKLEVSRLPENIPYKVEASCTLLKKQPSFSPSINFWPVQPSWAHYSSFHWHSWQCYKTVICTGARLSALSICIVQLHCTLTLAQVSLEYVWRTEIKSELTRSKSNWVSSLVYNSSLDAVCMLHIKVPPHQLHCRSLEVSRFGYPEVK